MRTRIFTSCLPLHRPSTAVDGTGSQIEQRLSKQGKNQDLRIQSKEVQCEASYLAQTQSLLPSHTRTFSRLRWPLQNKNRCPLRGSHDKRSRTRPYSPSNPLRMSVTPAAKYIRVAGPSQTRPTPAPGCPPGERTRIKIRMRLDPAPAQQHYCQPTS